MAITRKYFLDLNKFIVRLYCFKDKKNILESFDINELKLVCGDIIS
jgi:hypothetical protein